MTKNITRGIRRTPMALAAGLLFSVALAQPASAAETTSTLDVGATVTANCVVSTTALAFGSVDVTSGQNIDGTGGISVTCTTGTGWTAAADAGEGTGASLGSRKMANGANLLNYALYTDGARTSVWGDGVGGTSATISGTGSGSAQASTIYGRVASGQTSLPAGSYADTVAVTVTY
jgi:spore coat protein U-like protein